MMQAGVEDRKVALNATVAGACPARPHMSSAMNSTRLRRSSDIRSVLTVGCALHGRAMVVHARARGDSSSARWTTVAGRKVGGAVQRNRAKRRLRAVVAHSTLPPGHDVVVIARPAALVQRFRDLEREFACLIRRLPCAERERVVRG